jgi:hypothetical protein
MNARQAGKDKAQDVMERQTEPTYDDLEKREDRQD